MTGFQQQLASYVVNGLVVGSLYGLMSLGLTIISGVMKIINFAHGEFYMLGGYAAFLFSAHLGFGPVASILAAVVVVFLLGALVERTLLTPLYGGKLDRPDTYALMMTFAVSIFLINAVVAVFGPYQKAPTGLVEGSLRLGFLRLSAPRVAAAVISIALMTLFMLVLQRTIFGIALRAVALDRDAAAVCGIDVDRMNPLAFGLGTSMAAAAGALLAPVFLVYPGSGTLPALKAFAVIVLGGMESPKGAIVGAILLGVLESLSVLFLSPAYRDVYGFLVIVLVLLIRPTGLFGGKQL
jgi:branched-chain amino acid transport system permease protein